jgi:hypothetical protein
MIGEKKEAKIVVRGRRRRCRSYKGTWGIKTIAVAIL